MFNSSGSSAPLTAVNPLCGLWLDWYVEGHDRDEEFAIVVVGVSEDIAEGGFVVFAHLPLVVRMLGHSSGDGVEHVGEVCVPAEHEDCGFRVAPAEVGEELVDRFRECFFSFPEFAFADEDVASVRFDEDVGFPFVVESLASGLSLEVPVELDEEMGAQIFLAHFCERAGAILHDLDHVLDDAQDFVVDGRCKCWFWFEASGQDLGRCDGCFSLYGYGVGFRDAVAFFDGEA